MQNDVRLWRAFIDGPPDSCYSGFKFELRIVAGSDYPLLPPTITFVTKIFHPNVHFEVSSFI
jgi:peroxin-4